ncbi:hypothetical protein MXL46_19260 [Heyndrickxia sporothermodurans]|uniref:Uncharacterized protein n=1 Tax=Heyndrickxia sporothermodurans TaxID=46224 RepID=A0A150L5B4_9BACI|nr:hypothetical protein [Heyndrickxia sporothermodurans]KYD07493.1 hypothetical protein B4102_2937 [Heyndrickxia sporothermodurans]MEB6551185.1 hypothetical protein [Heyndrickxia sporothermodurans]MED3649532.1 hypothetical protein [Heyndrickxia sporothermodurans]MED3653840.1 hypothetical protein [Heyndrickxia sporothermodurans]MED3699044.1 hypothetical protein [Heyndrickxia sporothermodurans]
MLNSLNIFILNLFLYFPEDKREYIPAFISFSIFLILCILTFMFILRVNKKQLKKAKEFEEKIKHLK